VETSKFLDTQAEKLKAQLARTEQALAKFKEEHAGTLPTDTNLNREALDRAERDLEQANAEVRDLESRKDVLLADLSQTSPSAPILSDTGQPILGAEDRLEALRRQYVEMSARYGPEYPDLIRVKKEIALLSDGTGPDADRATLQEELDAKRTELGQLRKRYSDDHPDVKRLQRTVDELAREVRSAPLLGAAGGVRRPDNPAYVRLQAELDGLDTELAAQRADRDELGKKIAEYQARIARAPETERLLALLSRDYDIATRDYANVREKQAEAERAILVESEQKSERYVLQRDAPLPAGPAQPSHLTIVLAGLFLAMTAAIGAGILREAVDGTVRGPRDLRAMLNAPPIAVIPTVENGRGVWMRRARHSALALSYAMVTLFAIAAVA
jgi:uncharacterized protein involved in exopolysaccharide biosynthesis